MSHHFCIVICNFFPVKKCRRKLQFSILYLDCYYVHRMATSCPVPAAEGDSTWTRLIVKQIAASCWGPSPFPLPLPLLPRHVVFHGAPPRSGARGTTRRNAAHRGRLGEGECRCVCVRCNRCYPDHKIWSKLEPAWGPTNEHISVLLNRMRSRLCQRRRGPVP